MTKRVLELIRVSTESQAAEDRASIPSQRAINRRTAVAYGLTIVRSIEMADVSGAAVLMAPEMKELLILISDREIHGVVAREFSRLMRPENFSDYALLQAFADTNTVLYLPEGPIDFTSKTGRLMGTIRAAIAGMERTEILERIWSAKEEKRRNGELGQSHKCLPFGVGYDFKSRKWFYTADSMRVKEAFRLLLSGNTSYGSIARTVAMHSHTVASVLRNPIYTGWRVIDKKRDSSAAGKYVVKNGRQADRRKISRAPDEVIRVKVIEQPLVTEEEFNQAQRIMDHKKQFHWRMNDTTEHRFTYNGFLVCECGKAIHSRAQWSDYYACPAKCGTKYQRRDILDPHLDQIFAERLTSSAFLKRHVMPALERKPKPETNGEHAERQIELLTAKRRRILDTYFEGVINAGERDARLASVDKELKAFASIRHRERPSTDVTLQSLAETFAPFVEFDLLNREDKRALLSTLTPTITVANYEVKGLLLGSVQAHTGMDYHAPPVYLPLNLKAA